MGDPLIILNYKKQITFSKSSAEAEYRSIVSTVAEIVWIVGLVKELGVLLFPSRCLVISRLQCK